MSDVKIMPVIMSGGAGSRLWPLSRKAMPKQLLPLVTHETMVQETAVRFEGERYLDPVFICNALHASPISAQMAGIDCAVDAIIIEPLGRNTAPCAVVAACHAQKKHDGALVLLVPADHHVRKPEAFRAAVEAAIPAAQSGHLVTFGIQPDGPETGYGYIQRSGEINPGVYNVEAFKEKPDVETASRYLESGDYVWNAGIFLFAADTFLGEVEAFAPDILSRAAEAYEAATTDGNCISLDEAAFAACPGESIDYAVMEATQKAAVVPCDIGWSDIGSFASLQEVRADDTGNALSGDIMTVNTTNSLIMSDGPLVSAVGVDNVAIIVHEGQVLVLGLDAAQDVKKVVEGLKADGRTDCL